MTPETSTNTADAARVGSTGGSAIPAISSAYLNLGTARSDALMAEDAWEKENWPDALMWIDEAIRQLQSARAKIAAHASLPNAQSEPRGT